MGIESPVNSISDLNQNWPLASESRREGDDHLRLLKEAILNTFANINATVNITDEELNEIAGAGLTAADIATLLVTAIGTAEASKVLTASSGSVFDFNNFNMENVDINSGTIDGVPINGGEIGGTTPGNGTFNILTAITNLVADAIAERTLNAGVTIDGLKIKDGGFELGLDTILDMYYRGSSGELIRVPGGTKGQRPQINNAENNIQFINPGVLQVVTVESVAGEISGSGVGVTDTPTITQGTQVLSGTITPLVDSSEILFEVFCPSAWGSVTNIGGVMVQLHLYINGASASVAGGAIKNNYDSKTGDGSGGGPITFMHKLTPGSVAAITFELRVSSRGSSAGYVNTLFNDKFGSKFKTTLRATEHLS